jgi:hypothetical protein
MTRLQRVGGGGGKGKKRSMRWWRRGGGVQEDKIQYFSTLFLYDFITMES